MRCPPDELIAAFVDGDAPATEAAALRQHLAECDVCTELVGDYAAAFGLASASVHTQSSIPPTKMAIPDGRAVTEGEMFGRYVVLALAGRGGMGEVYVAYDPDLDRKVALKTVRRATSSSSADSDARLLDEARLAASLRHPNIVEVYDVGTDRDRAYIAMEYVEGQPLSRWASSTARGVGEIVEVFTAAAKGLQAAHDASIVHRDFKPSNVLVGTDGRVRVADFGLARARADPESARPVGTPRYMAPEQRRGETADARSDQYSFCVAMFEALHGHRPSCEGSPTGRDDATPADPLPQERPSRSNRRRLGRIDAVLQRGLSSDPDERWESMRALIAALPRSRPPSRLIWVACTAAIAGGAVLGTPRAANPRCHGDDDLATVWGPDQRTRVREAILSTETVYAEAAADAADRSLQRYATRWLAAHDRLCRARADATRENPCLTRSLTELDATITVLRDADADVASRVAMVVAELPDPHACSDDGSRTLPPSASREQIDDVEAQLARAQALRRAGKYIDAETVMRIALPQAEATDHTPLVARALYAAGTLAVRVSKFDQAAQQIERAAWLAASVSDDALHVRALGSLIGLEGTRRSRPDAARAWIRRAKTALHHAGDAPALEQALLQAEGGFWAIEGEDERAIRVLSRAAELAERVYGTEDFRVGNTQQALGIALLNAGKLDAARQTLERSLAITEATFGPNHPTIANVLDVLGATALQQQDSAAARQYAERALRITEAAFGPDDLKTGIAHQHLGVMLEAVGEPARGGEHLDTAIALLREHGGPEHVTLITALDARGSIRYKLGQLEAAEADLRRGIAIAAVHRRQQHAHTSVLWSHLGDVLRVQGRLDAARRAHETALATRRLLGRPHYVAASLDALARVAEDGGERSRARQLYEQAADQWSAALGETHAYAVASREAAANLEKN